MVLLNAGALLIAAAAADAWLTPRLADWISLGRAGELFHAPNAGTLLVILEVIATSSAAVIALILSISMLVLDRSAEKFGGQVARLQLDDPLRRYVVDLLVVSFMLSLWGLFLSRTPGLQPIVTTIAAGGALSLGVVTLVTYHDHAFSFMVSSQAANSLENRAQLLLTRLAQEAHRPTIADHLRRRMIVLIDGQRSLIRVLLTNRDDEGAAYVVSALAGELGRYVRAKDEIPTDSAWFPTEWRRLTPASGSSYLEMRGMMRSSDSGRQLPPSGITRGSRMH